MPDFIKKKLQVFVSSTYLDLREERQAAVEAILAAGHIPAGMELFTAGDESQMEVIRQWIDESDVYMLILGARYGSVDKAAGKSYTQIEYEYAVSKSKPLFACVIDETIIEDRVKKRGLDTIERENPKQLQEFRKLVLSKISKFWQDTKDIKITIIETLGQLARRDGLDGWVRPATQSNLPALADEITRLSRENAQLREQLSTASIAQEEKIRGVSFKHLKELLIESNLLDFFIVNVKALGSPSGLTVMKGPNKKPADELVSRGLIDLIEQRGGMVFIYRLSDAGLAFVNRYEVEQMIDRKGKRSEQVTS